MHQEPSSFILVAGRLLRAEVKKLPDVSAVDVTTIAGSELTTVVVDYKRPIRTTDLISLMQSCVRYFGEQGLPTIETGDQCIIIYNLGYQLRHIRILEQVSFYVC